jgi:hypothetical protein
MYSCVPRGETVVLPVVNNNTTVTGFNSQFTDATDGWIPQSGAWTVNSGAMGTPGVPNHLSTASYWQSFANLDFSARVARSGCSTCGNGVIVRGKVDPKHADSAWDSFYMFLYSNSGSATVLKSVNGGSLVALHPWTATPAIVPGGYNTLRVVATGSNLSYYINGTLVWSGADTSLANGQIGFVMWRDSYSNSNWFDVDYAVLTGGTSSLAQQEVSTQGPETYSEAEHPLYMSP